MAKEVGMSIEDWRKKIDQIDMELVELLNQRGQCAVEIGTIKEGLKVAIYDPSREKSVIRNVQKATKGPLTRQAMKRLFERIIDESRRAERESRPNEEGSAPVRTRTNKKPKRKVTRKTK